MVCYREKYLVQTLNATSVVVVVEILNLKIKKKKKRGGGGCLCMLRGAQSVYFIENLCKKVITFGTISF